jgi:hypothetical protein
MLLALLAACETAGVPRDPSPAASLPPLNDVAFFEDLYGEDLAALGLRFTRAARFEENLGHAPYSPSPTGTHLALYAEPVGTYTAERFLGNIAPLTQVFRDVFERWPGLTSFDICQEPIQSEATEEREPVPASQVRISKTQALALDWDRLDLPILIRAATRKPPQIILFVSRRLRGHPAYERALRAAGQPVNR